jgi:hypothetical protein
LPFVSGSTLKTSTNSRVIFYQVHSYTIARKKSKQDKWPRANLGNRESLDAEEEVFPGRFCFSPSPKLLPVGDPPIHVSDEVDNQLEEGRDHSTVCLTIDSIADELERSEFPKHISICSRSMSKGEEIGVSPYLDGAAKWLVPELEYEEWKDRGNAGA